MADTLRRSQRSAAKGAPSYSMDDPVVEPPDQARVMGRGRGKSVAPSTSANKTLVGFRSCLLTFDMLTRVLKNCLLM